MTTNKQEEPMSLSNLTTVAPLVGVPTEIPRDRYGRPMVTPAAGGKPIPYSRCTSWIDVLDDKYNLQLWMQRMVALGLATRPDLLLSVSAHRDDKGALNKIVGEAREAAGASAAATTGTALHSLTEMMDRGIPLPAGLPPHAQASLDAYAAATKCLKSVHIERFVVQDHLKVGGTPDRVVEFEGSTYIADLKTGSIEWGALKIAMQLSVYARSTLYDHNTGERTPHGADVNRGIVIHLPAVTDPVEARCDIHWIDLEAGNAAVNVAKQVRDQRTRKFKDLMEPFTGQAPTTVKIRHRREAEAKARLRAAQVADDLAARIHACPTVDDVRALWSANETDWTPALTAAAKKHIKSIPTVA